MGGGKKEKKRSVGKGEWVVVREPADISQKHG